MRQIPALNQNLHHSNTCENVTVAEILYQNGDQHSKTNTVIAAVTVQVNRSSNSAYRQVYLSFDALSSKTASLKEGPSSARAKHRMLVVLPVPGGPWN